MTPTFAAAINKPRLLFGIERRLLVVALLVPGLAGAAIGEVRGLVAMIVGSIVTVPIAAFISRKDHCFLAIMRAVVRQKAIYDPGKRVEFGLTIH